MPRKAGQPNKSAAVRELLSKNPKMPVKEIVSTLAQKNMKVHPNLVYGLKAHMRHKRVKQRRQAAGQVTGHANSVDVVPVIRRVRDLARDVGGMSKLQELVAVLAE